MIRKMKIDDCTLYSSRAVNWELTLTVGLGDGAHVTAVRWNDLISGATRIYATAETASDAVDLLHALWDRELRDACPVDALRSLVDAATADADMADVAARWAHAEQARREATL